MSKKVVRKQVNSKGKVSAKKVEEAPVVQAAPVPEAVTEAPVDKEAILRAKAYHGGRKTEIAVEGTTGGLFGAGIVASILKQNKIHFTEAEAVDGTVIRAFNKALSEEFRLFLSKRPKYDGMFGVSGKCRALMESNVNADYGWVQQGSKNYYFSGNTAALVRFLGA